VGQELRAGKRGARRETPEPKDYAVRLRCSQGGEDVWVILEKRTETTEEIFRSAWDFECPLHGVQSEMPIDVQEKGKIKLPAPKPARPLPPRWKAGKSQERSGQRLFLRVPVLLYGWVRSRGAFHEETQTQMVNPSGALVLLHTPVEIGETFFVVNKATGKEQECRVAYVAPGEKGGLRAGIAFKQPLADFWRTKRQKPRIPRSLKVWVKGKDRQGHPFAQSAYTVNISQNGARLDGPGYITGPGDIIEVKRGWHKARFRVIWTGTIGTPEANHIGICCLEADKNLWGVVPGESQPGAAVPAAPPKKQSSH
jgi:hypothetical protein